MSSGSMGIAIRGGEAEITGSQEDREERGRHPPADLNIAGKKSGI